jgi:acid phosphatase family membrane protein YuiD
MVGHSVSEIVAGVVFGIVFAVLVNAAFVAAGLG